MNEEVKGLLGRLAQELKSRYKDWWDQERMRPLVERAEFLSSVPGTDDDLVSSIMTEYSHESVRTLIQCPPEQFKLPGPVDTNLCSEVTDHKQLIKTLEKLDQRLSKLEQGDR